MTPRPIIDLRKRFKSLWRRCLLPGAADESESRFDGLLRRYGATDRRYHGWGHLTHCLCEFDESTALMTSPDAVEMALWLHDVVYVAGAPTNERDSAALFERMASGQIAPECVEKVCHYIMLTRHRDEPLDSDGCYVVDIDLSQLASEWPEYLQDSENLRKEASNIPDDVYYPAQLVFLRSLLGRKRVFRTEWFHARYEDVARHNVTAFIEHLQSKGFT